MQKPQIDGRDNNVGLVRLSLALLVLFSHCFPLTTGSNESEPLHRLTGGTTFGTLAVNGFFLLSGILVTESWLRSRGAGSFLVKRATRIYPGFIAAVFVSVIAGAISAGPSGAGRYLREIYWTKDGMLQSILFLEFPPTDHEPAFPNNPFPKAVNGSLWTLQPEFRCYGVVLAIGLAGLLRPKPLVTVAIVIYAAYGFVTVTLKSTEFTYWRFLTYFLFGAVIAVCKFRITKIWAIMGGFALAASMAVGNSIAFELVLPIAAAVILLAIAFETPPLLPRFFAKWDVSYGVYLYAFPVQQCVVASGVRDPAVLFAIASPITILLGLVSWVAIERPALKWGHARAKEGWSN